MAIADDLAELLTDGDDAPTLATVELAQRIVSDLTWIPERYHVSTVSGDARITFQHEDREIRVSVHAEKQIYNYIYYEHGNLYGVDRIASIRERMKWIRTGKLLK